VATFAAGTLAPAADAALAEHGLTIGHVPQSYERATLGGFAATRSAGQASTGIGRFEDLVEHLVVATPEGELRLGRAPASAAGPDLRQLLLGSEGTLGVITEVGVRVRAVPEVRRVEGWTVADFATGAELLRGLAQDGLTPDIARLCDEAETALGVATAGEGGQASGCLLLLGWEGAADVVDARRAAAAARVEQVAAIALGEEAGEHWLAGRFRGPYLRDELIDLGVLVETLETATSWRALHELHQAVGTAVREALAPAVALVTCHISHLYPGGASLYFTVVSAQDAGDPAGQWRAAKRAAGDAIARAGATITHHHAVGSDHAPWMAAEVGELGLEALSAVKARLDPQGILNPGKLLGGA
jgi:alkyldihydroxyacetonephosphate synthase